MSRQVRSVFWFFQAPLRLLRGNTDGATINKAIYAILAGGVALSFASFVAIRIWAACSDYPEGSVSVPPPFICTDRNDYMPADTAVINGYGFEPGEYVEVIVLHTDGTSEGGEDHEPWQVVADENGDFTTVWHVCEDDCVGSALRVTATGLNSGGTATADFYDAFNGSDNACDATYNDGWQATDNGGSGFTAWTFNNAANSGVFVGNSNGNGSGGGPGINCTPGTRAWGLFANSGATASVTRDFAALNTLQDGQTFTIDFDNGNLTSSGGGASQGFGLQTSTGVNRFEFFFKGGNANYSINDSVSGFDTGISFTDGGLHIVFTLTAVNTYNVSITKLSTSVTTTFTGRTLGGTAGTRISRIRLFHFNPGGGGGPTDAFFNNMSVACNNAPATSISGPTTICTGVSTAYSNTGNNTGSRTWFITANTANAAFDGGVNSGTTVNITATQAGSFTLTLTNALSGCTNSASTTVTVNTSPSATITKTGGTDCANTQDTFSGPAGVSYSWSITTTTSGATISGSTTSQSVTLNNGTTAGSYTLRLITTSGGCSTTNSTTVTVNVTACSISGATTVCTGTTNTYTGPAGANLTYSWSVSSPASVVGSSASQSVSIDSDGATSYTLSLTVSNTSTSCSSTCSTIVTVTTPSCTISGPTSVCQAATNTFTSTSNGSTHSWSFTSNTAGATFVGSTSSSSVQVTTTSSGSYSLRDDIGLSGCSAFCTYGPVTANANPTCSISGPATPCKNSTANYSGPAGMTGYSWSLSNANGATISGANNAQTVSVATDGSGSFTLNLTITDANGCSGSCSTNITTDVTGPTITTQPSPSSTNICSGGSISYSVTANDPNGTSYQWAATTWGNWIQNANGGGFFVSSSKNNDASDATCTTGEINTNNKAWGMFHSGANATEAIRPLSASGQTLAVGQSFSIDIDNGNLTTGNSVGFSFRNPSNQNVWELYFKGGNCNYFINDSRGLDQDSGLRFTRGGVHVAFTLTSTSTYSVTLSRISAPTDCPPPGSCPSTPNSVTVTGTVINVVDKSIDRLRVFDSNGATGGDFDFYFNNIGFDSKSDNANNYDSSTWTNGSNQGSTTLSNGTTANGSTMSGATSATLTISNAQTGDSGNYQVIVTDSCGNATTSSVVSLTINQTPSCSISGPTTVCSGTSNNYSGPATPAGQTFSYSWTLNPANGATFSGGGTTASGQNVIVNSDSATAGYTLSLTIARTDVTPNCGSSCSQAVTVNQTPDSTITAPAAVCSGTTTNSASAPSASGVTFTWTISNGTITSGQGTSSITFTAGASGSISLSVTASNITTACKSTSSVTIPINPNPSAAFTGPATACTATTNNYTAVTTGANIAYSWSLSANTSGATITAGANSQTVTVASGDSTGSYTLNLTVTDTSTGCSSSSSQTVVVTASVVCSISGSNAVCAASSGNSYSGPGGFDTYSWTISGNGSITAGANSQTVVVSAGAAGSFTLSLSTTGPDGCASTSCSKTVTVNANPVCSITGPGIAGAAPPCPFTTATYSAPSGMASYGWTVASSTPSGCATISGASNQQSVSIMIDAGSCSNFTLQVTITDGNGCSSTCSQPVTVDNAPPTITQQPQSQTVCSGSNVTFSVTATDDNPLTYQWRKRGTGWGAGGWDLTRTGSPGGFFLNTSKGNNAGGSTSNGGNDIDTAGKSWGMFNKQTLGTFGDTTEALRNFNGTMQVGDTFTIDMDNGGVNNGGSVGFGLQAGAANNRLEFYFKGGNCDYFVHDNSSLTRDSGVQFTRIGVRVKITLTGANTYVMTIIRFAGGNPATTGSCGTPPANATTNTFTGTLLGAGSIDRVRLFYAGNGDYNDGDNDLFFNSIGFDCKDDNAGNYATWTNGSDLGNAPLATAPNSSTFTITNAQPSDAGSYDVCVHDSCNNLTASAIATLTVNPNPTCSITGSATVCAGTTNTYTAPANMTSYAWTISGNGTINGSASGQSVSVIAGSSGSFTLTLSITDANGCSSTCNKSVAISAFPTCTISGSDSVCAGSTANQYCGPAGSGLSYQWMIAGNGSISGSSTSQCVSVTAGSPGLFTLTLTVIDNSSPAGCTSICAKIVTVNASPACSITGPNPVCSGSTGNMYSGPSGVGLSFSWSISGNGTIDGSTSAQTVSISADGAGTFTLSLIVSASGCSSTCSTNITVNAAPVCSITGSAAVCANSTNTYSGPANQGAYSWSVTAPATIVGSTTSQSVSVASDSATSFTLTLTTSNAGCPDSTCSKAVTVNSNPACSISGRGIGGSAPPCPYTTVSYSASAGMASYSWTVTSSTPSGCATISGASNQQSVNIMIDSGSCTNFTLSVTETDTNGCSSTCSQQVTVDNTPPTITQQPSNQAVCQGGSATFSVTATDQNALSYMWRKRGTGWGGGGWQLNVTSTDTNKNGFFVGTSTVNDGGDPGNDGDIDIGGVAWALYANKGNLAEAIRPFNGSIQVGDTFQIDLDTGYINTDAENAAENNGVPTGAGSVGFGLQAGAGNNRLEFFFRGGDLNYSYFDGAGFHFSGTSIPYTGQGLRLKITLTGANTYRIIISSVGTDGPPGLPVTITGTLANAGNIDRLRVFNFNAGEANATACAMIGRPTGCRDSFFNNIGFDCKDDNASNYTTATWVNGSDKGNGPIPNTDSSTFTITNAQPSDAGSYDVCVHDNCNNLTVSSNATLTVNSNPTCTISGPSSVCPSSTGTFSSTVGMTSYSWSISGSGTIVGSSSAQSVIVQAGSTCNGSFTLTVSITNSNGCSSTCSTTVSVVDNTPPTITCSTNVIVLSANSTCHATLPDETGNATASDNCGPVTLTQNPPAGSTLNRGSTNVTITATDGCGNSSSCQVTVLVKDTTPPTITCPAPITTSTDPGQCSATVSYTTTVSDNCDPNPTVTCAPASGSAFPKGTTTVNCTATDCDLNTNSCSFTVTVNDTEAPMVSCSNIGVSTDPGQCSASNVTYSTSATDNCPGVSAVTCTPPSGSTFPRGTTPVTCSATDASGNTGTCSFNVTVTDNQAPTITCPANVVTNTAPGQCSQTVSYSPTSSDNCPGVTTSCTPPSGSAFQRGTTNVNCTATDDSGNSASCSFTVTVNDTEAPVLSGCPAPTDSVQCYSDVPAASTVTATDNCDGSVTVNYSETQSNPNSSCSNTITRTWTATDSSGNTASCSQTITVNDTTPPVITCPADTTISCTASTNVTATGSATATDNCGSATVTHSDTVIPGSCTSNFIILRNFTATDGCGNTASCTQTIHVTDTTPPTISCPADKTVDCKDSTDPSDTGSPTSNDDCSGVVVTHVDVITPGNCAGNYTITRTFIATDACTNTATCVQTISVTDTTAPTIACPADKAIDCTASTNVTATGNATATDDCSGVASITHSDTVTPGNCAGNYTIHRTFIATDGCGNAGQCTQTITVTDTHGPTISCPADTSIDCSASTNVTNTGSATATDDCSGVASITHSDTVTPGNCAGNYTIHRTFIATDGCGNSSICTQTIIVSDTTPPTITCPADVMTNTDPGQCYASGVALGSPTTSDNCDSTVSVVNNAPSQFPVGTNTVVWTATDSCGNSSTCTQKIIVVDNQPPTISCPTNVTVQCYSQVPPHDFAGGSASDNCGTPTVTWVSDSESNPGSSCSNIITRTYKATDASGNTANCTQTITVNDTTPPTISCPADVSVNTDAGQCYASGVALGSPTTSDNCGGTVSVVNNAPSSFSVGTNTVVWTATDSCGNSSTCTQKVVVVDNQAPTINCPANVTVQCYSQVPPHDFAGGSASDNCGTPTVTWVSDSESNPGSSCNNVITRTYRATDASGNSSTCTQVITVDDTTAPTLAAVPANTTAECDAVPAPATVTATDNCDPNPQVSFSEARINGTCEDNYTLVRSWTATDGCGNTTFASQTITVHDTTAPTLHGVPANQTAQCDSVPAPATVTATDNCDPNPTVTMQETTTPGNCSGDYTLTRTWTATDRCGNSSSASQTITVSDTTGPTMSCPPDKTVQCYSDAGTAAADTAGFQAQGGSVSDNCSSATVTLESESESNPSSSCNNTISRTYKATDDCGNTSHCTQTITVNDTTPPTMAGCTDQTVLENQVTTNAQTCITANFNGTPIDAGNWIWFNSVLKPSSTNSTYTINITGQTISGTIGGSNVTMTVPDAQITYSSANTSASTTFVGGKWVTTAPLASKLAGNQFMSALAYQLPFDSAGGGSLTWCATFSVTPGVTLNWKWAAAVYTNFTDSYNSLGVKPVDDSNANSYKNSDHAGTPENYKQFTVGGARGGGAANATGSYSGTAVGNVSGTFVCSAGAVNYAQPVSTDNCDGMTTVNCSPQPGTSFNMGTNSVTCTATDSCGNATNCTFKVIVVKPPPTITCPGNIVTNTTSSTCAQTVKFTLTSKSACGGSVSNACSPASGTSFPKGTTTVNCTASETGGSKASCSFTVTVNDKTKPTISCPSSITTNICGPVVVNYRQPTASDNCPGVNASCLPASGSSFSSGSNTVTCIATDTSSNTATCKFYVVVGTAPSVPSSLSLSASTGQIKVTWKASTGTTPITYNVKRSTTGTAGSYALIGSSSTNSYVDATTVAGTKYYYVVSSTNCVKESANSSSAYATAK